MDPDLYWPKHTREALAEPEPIVGDRAVVEILAGGCKLYRPNRWRQGEVSAVTPLV